MDKDTLAFLHYCLSLLDMLSNSSLSYIEDVQINADMMTFTGKYTDAFIFDSDWLNRDYQHHTTVVGMNCDFHVIRQPH